MLHPNFRFFFLIPIIPALFSSCANPDAKRNLPNLVSEKSTLPISLQDSQSQINEAIQVFSDTSLPIQKEPSVTRSEPTQAPSPAAEKRMDGLLYLDELGMYIQSCSPPFEKYRIAMISASLRNEFITKKPMLSYPGEPLVASFKGIVETSSEYADFNGSMQVKDIISVTSRNIRTNCMPFSFHALGTEPFWNLYISDTENLISLKILAENRALRFPYQSPLNEGEKLIYRTKDNTGNFLTITVKKESCSDGMSDATYNYSIEATYQEQTYLGCAFVGTEIQ